MIIPPIVIRVDIPALDALVSYLTSAQQPEIDAMATMVAVGTSRLKQSAQALNDAIPKP